MMTRCMGASSPSTTFTVAIGSDCKVASDLTATSRCMKLAMMESNVSSCHHLTSRLPWIIHPLRSSSSGKCGDSDKGIYSFKIFKISIITIRIAYHQTRLENFTSDSFISILHILFISYFTFQFYLILSQSLLSYLIYCS